MVVLRPLTIDEMPAAALVRRLAFEDGLPWLGNIHTLEDDNTYFENVLFSQCTVWGAFEAGNLLGIMALRPGWIDQLYVLPSAQGKGVGSRLMELAKTQQPDLSLWTFQRNSGARRFYERHGFIDVEETDGSTNEEREPDIRYRWWLNDQK